jgi:hypothetical protein
MPDLFDLAAAFDRFERSAWRLCARDTYDVAEERDVLAAWREHRPLPPRADGWPDILRSRLAAGRQVGRVQLFTRPLGDYARFLLAHPYPENVALGEVVRVGYRDQMPADLAAVREDFWVFDGQEVAVMEYDDAGRFLRAVNQSGDLDRYLRLQMAMISASQPLADVGAVVGQ